MILKQLFPLMIIISVSWVLVILEAYLFFAVVLPLSPPIHRVGISALVAILKIAMTILLAIAWFAIMILLRYVYVKRSSSRSTPN